jgi:hypothetical protein
LSGLSVIRRLAESHRSGKPAAPEDLSILLEGLVRYLDTDCIYSLDTCLGVRRRGGVSPQKEEWLDWRNERLVRLWRECPDYAGLSATSAAKKMAADARQYEALRSPSMRQPRPSQEPRRTFWDIRVSGLKIPDAKRMTAILRG